MEEAIANFSTVTILSNCSEEREAEVRKELRALNVWFFRAQPKKPDPFAFQMVFQERQIPRKDALISTLYIGDRPYTDVYGAHRAGIASVILVEPIEGKEQLPIRAARLLENRIYGSQL